MKNMARGASAPRAISLGVMVEMIGRGIGMDMRKIFIVLIAIIGLGLPAVAADAQENMVQDSRAATGGAQTLADILARQSGQKMDDSFRSDALGTPENAASSTNQLGTLGGVSDPELWRALRYGKADVNVSSHGLPDAVIIQDSGMDWLTFRHGPLSQYGGNLLLGVIAALAVFYALRGKIRIDGERTGRTILRFKAIERFAHWLLAGSFVVLALTGLMMVFGRLVIIPLMGKESFAAAAAVGKWSHNNFSWAFMVALVLVTIFWLAQNIPNRHDLKWLAMAGGMFSKGAHPPAKKFNAGQKLIFWGVLVLGFSISASGLSLMFPFQLPMFGATFAKINAIGLPELMGFAALPEALMPHQEMQLAILWHGIVAFVFMAIIIAHIYLGSVGMEGAFDAMGTGEVDEQWAKEHHGLWYEEVTGKSAHDDHAPVKPAE